MLAEMYDMCADAKADGSLSAWHWLHGLRAFADISEDVVFELEFAQLPARQRTLLRSVAWTRLVPPRRLESFTCRRIPADVMVLARWPIR